MKTITEVAKHPLANRVDVSTTDYQMSHGHEPRGRGRGWIFCPRKDWNTDHYLDSAVNIGTNSTYAEARKMAQNYFAAAGADSIVACT